MLRLQEAIKGMMVSGPHATDTQGGPPMKKLLLIATLSLGAFALAQPMASNMGDSQGADHDFYNQAVAAQAKHNSLFLAANALSALPPAQFESLSGSQPSSMAANAGSQSTGDDFYNQTIAAQANETELIQAAGKF
jgi:hypothetical protein